MKVCIGRFDWLPKNWDGINDLYDRSGAEIIAEAERQSSEIMQSDDQYFALQNNDRFVGVHELVEFEEEFNHWLDDGRDLFSPLTHWIKFVDDNGNKLPGI